MKTRQIPLNPKIPPELENILPTGQLVLFVGAGVSRLLGYPSWKYLAEKLLTHIAKEKQFKHFSFADIESIKSLSPKQKISIAIDILKSQASESIDVLNLLEEMLKPEKKRKSNIYQLLVNIPTNFITTNYDLCLTETIPQPLLKINNGQSFDTVGENKKLNKYFQAEELTIDKLTNFGNVFHLHGSLDSESSLVLTTRDYIKHYKKKLVIDFLDHLFDQYNVLFIGYGLEEEEILEYVIRKKEKQQNVTKECKHFRLFPAYSFQRRLVRNLTLYYQNQCDIQLIPYCIDKRGHDQLEVVLEKWLPELKTKISPLGFTKTVKNVLDRVIDEN